MLSDFLPRALIGGLSPLMVKVLLFLLEDTFDLWSFLDQDIFKLLHGHVFQTHSPIDLSILVFK